MSTLEETCFELVGLRVRLVAPPELWEPLAARLPPVTPSSPMPPSDRTYRVESIGDAGPGLLVRRERRRPVVAGNLLVAADLVTADLERFAAQRAPGVLFLHAGAVAWRGRAIVLPGPSGTGKSELVVALLRAGAELLSDEFAVLDTAVCAHPYPRPVVLRGSQVERRWPESFGARAAAEPTPVAVVALVCYRPGGSWNVSPLSRGETFLAMLRHTVAARRRFELARAVLLPLAAARPALVGSRGAADEAAGELLALAS